MKRVDLDLDIGEETLLAGREINNNDRTARELAIDELELSIKFQQGDIAEEDCSYDSEFMLQKVRELGKNTHTYYF